MSSGQVYITGIAMAFQAFYAIASAVMFVYKDHLTLVTHLAPKVFDLKRMSLASFIIECVFLVMTLPVYIRHNSDPRIGMVLIVNFLALALSFLTFIYVAKRSK